MTYLETWRSKLKQHLTEFAPLAQEDRSINLIFGITAAAVLWSVRDAPFNDEQKTALRIACGNEQHLPHLLRAVGGWDEMTPLEAARNLSERQDKNEVLQAALIAVMGTFVDELFAEKMVQIRTDINVSGSISGGNIVIGGYQIVAGDLVINYITEQKIRACPTAPKPPAHFAGRRDEIDRIKSLLRQGQNTALTSIQGMGGIGKTALAQKLAGELPELGAVLWGSVGQSPSPINTLILWAQHADPAFTPSEDDHKDPERLAQRVQALLTNLIKKECPGPVLVVFDDVWEGDGVHAARLLQKAAPANSVTLITTRSQQVVAQLRSTRVELGYMVPPDALQMLRNLLQAYPEITDDTLLLLAKTVGYHPLAMELAAGQVSLLERPAQDINELIKRYQGGIPAGSPFQEIKLEIGEDREDSLELVLSFSYDSLDEIEQMHFRALGALAFDTPFSRDICEAILQNESFSSLDALRHRAMLTIAEEQGWYRQHPLLRAYARALLIDAGETDTTFNHYADYITYNVTSQFTTMPPETWESKMSLYFDHVHYVGNLLVQEIADNLGTSDPKLHRAVTFSLNSANYLINRRELRFNSWLEMGRIVSERLGEEEHSIYFLNVLGDCLFAQGNINEATKSWYSALTRAKKIGDLPGEATANLNLARFCLVADVLEAPKFIYPAIELFKRLNNADGVNKSLFYLASVYIDKCSSRDDLECAIGLLIQALPHEFALFPVAEFMIKIGQVFNWLGEWDKAITYLNMAVDELRTSGRHDLQALSSLFLASTYANMEQLEKAQPTLEEALAQFQLVADPAGIAVSLLNLGQSLMSRGQFSEALIKFAQVVPMYHQQNFLDDHLRRTIIVPQFFEVQYDEIVKQMTTERSRARAIEHIKNSPINVESQSDAYPGEQRTGIMPEIITRTLVTKTIALSRHHPEKQADWIYALQSFIETLYDHGQTYKAEGQFAQALVDVSLNRQVQLLQKNPYAYYVEGIKVRLQNRRLPEPLIQVQDLEMIIRNTLAVKINEQDKLRTWEAELNKLCQQFEFWDDTNELELLRSLLSILEKRPAGISQYNPYYPTFQSLLNILAEYETNLATVLVERTAAVKTVAVGQKSKWREYLVNLSAEIQDNSSSDFLKALIQIVDGSEGVLQNAHPFQPYLQDLKVQITTGRPIFSLIPKIELQTIAENTISVKTMEPKAIDAWRETLQLRLQVAIDWDHKEDVALYTMLISILDQPSSIQGSNIYKSPLILPGLKREELDLPQNHLYTSILNQIVQTIQKSSVKSLEDSTLPTNQIIELFNTTLTVITVSPQNQENWRNNLLRYRNQLVQRGQSWINEVEMLNVLLALLENIPITLSGANPYYDSLNIIAERIKSFRANSDDSLNIPPHDLEALLQRSFSLSKKFYDLGMEALNTGAEVQAMWDTFTINADLVEERGRWIWHLLALRADAADKGAPWSYEIEVYNALFAVMEKSPIELKSGNPYRNHVLRVANEFEYEVSPLGNSSLNFVAARALPFEEFREQFSQNWMHKLETAYISRTIAVMTIDPDGLEEWKNWLYEAVAEHSQMSDLAEFQQALIDTLDNQPVSLSEDNKFSASLQTIENALENYRFLKFLADNTLAVKTHASDRLTDWRERISSSYEQALTDSAHTTWAEFFGALLAIVENKPVNLPKQDPFRYLIQKVLESL